MTEGEPEPINPLSPSSPSAVPGVPAGGRTWFAAFVTLVILAFLVRRLLPFGSP